MIKKRSGFVSNSSSSSFVFNNKTATPLSYIDVLFIVRKELYNLVESKRGIGEREQRLFDWLNEYNGEQGIVPGINIIESRRYLVKNIFSGPNELELEDHITVEGIIEMNVENINTDIVDIIFVSNNH